MKINKKKSEMGLIPALDRMDVIALSFSPRALDLIGLGRRDRDFFSPDLVSLSRADESSE